MTFKLADFCKAKILPIYLGIKQIMMTYPPFQSHNWPVFSQHNRHGPEVRLSHRVQKVRCATRRSDKKTGESYNLPSALGHRVIVPFYEWCAGV